MRKPICIIAGDPNSVNSEIISKAWKKKTNLSNKNIFVIGNYDLISSQLKKIKANISLKKITTLDGQNFTKKLLIFDVPLKFKNPFNVPKKNKYKYIMRCFRIAMNFSKKKEVLGFINCPINKSDIFGNRTIGVTEYLAKKERKYGKEAMLIYNKKLAVSPITTHIQVKKISRVLNIKLIINKLITIDKFYRKNFYIKPKIGLLGLNPHNYEFRKNSEEVKIIIPALKKLKKININVNGPLSADTAFTNYEKKKINVLVGMYHDQVLSPFKTIFKFNAINVTLGLPYIRVSPDHGTGQDIIKKNKASPESLIESINFFSKINVNA